jgi:excisionase family DNA binding protein
LKTIVTPRELAEAIGVSESSVKRWVDHGDIVAMRTAGGHRRISIQEAGRYLRERSIPLVRPDRLGLSDLAAHDEAESEVGDAGARLFDYLRRGAELEARGLILSLYLQGQSVAEIMDGPLCAAMARIGELWVHGASGIFWEHRATQVVMQALARLRLLIEVPPDAPVAVGGAPAGDVYLLPSMAVAAVLEGEAVEAVNLGADVPVESLALAAEELNARLVWLSVSFIAAPDQLREAILVLLTALAERGAPLVIGGRQAKKLRLPKSGLLYVGGSMAELEALVRGMKLPASTRAVSS